jgi:hypothetical protein
MMRDPTDTQRLEKLPLVCLADQGVQHLPSPRETTLVKGDPLITALLRDRSDHLDCRSKGSLCLLKKAVLTPNLSSAPTNQFK